MDCSGEHRGFGVNVSFIKSVTLDSWTQAQVNIMKVGGNQRLRDFLMKNGMPDELDKKDIYASNLMSYYRRMLKTESKGELFVEPIPPKSRWWEPAGNDQSYDNNNYANQLFTGNTSNSFGSSSYSSNYDYKPPSSDITGTSNFYNNPDSYPKSEIVISDNHYQQAKNYSDVASQFANKIPSEPKFASVNSNYKNDPRFASIGSDPSSVSSSSSSGGSGSYLYGLGSMLGTVWNTSVNVASAVKDKMNEYEVGSKLLYVGGKTLQGVAYVGGKMIEKGGEIAQSETVHNLGAKVGQGLGYIKDKIVGGTSSNSVSSDSYRSGNYSSTGSDSYDRY